MRGQINRSGVRVEREVAYEEINLISPPTEYAEWTASFEGRLREGDIYTGRDLESISLSFTKPTYDEALDALMEEFTALDIEVV